MRPTKIVSVPIGSTVVKNVRNSLSQRSTEDAPFDQFFMSVHAYVCIGLCLYWQWSVLAVVWRRQVAENPLRESRTDSYSRNGQPVTGSPLSASIASSRLYFAKRSDWVIDPTLI